MPVATMLTRLVFVMKAGWTQMVIPVILELPFRNIPLRVLVMLLLKEYPGSRVVGHRDLSPDLNHNGEIEPEEWIKECPCFDAATILQEPPPSNPAYL